MIEIVRPFKTGENVALQLYHSFLCHPHFFITLLIVLPLELCFMFLNHFFWGIHNMRMWHIITKPMPMVLIIAATLSFIQLYGGNRFRTFMLLGLVLSLIADVILIPDGDEFFLAGLVVFFCAHVMYIIAFSIPQSRDGEPVPLNYMRSIYFVALMMILPAVLSSKMLEDGTDMILVYSVMAYSAIISTLGWRAAARIGYATETMSSQIVAFIGALLFICSDATLAFNRFYMPIPHEKIIVLSTYWIAQTCFVYSLQRTPWHSEELLAALKPKVEKLINKM